MDLSMRWLARNGGPGTDPFPLLIVGQLQQREMLGVLAGLIANPDADDAEATAELALGYLAIELAGQFADEAALLLVMLDKVDDTIARPVFETVRQSHDAVRELLPLVIDGLRHICLAPLTSLPDGFAAAATLLCELLKMHGAYVDGMLLPLVHDCADADTRAALARDIADRRLMMMPAAGGDRPRTSAPGRTLPGWVETGDALA